MVSKVKLIGLIVILFTLFSCKDTLTIYNHNKTYTYDSFFIQGNDTISKETLIIQPKRNKWLLFSRQRAVRHLYFPDTVSNVMEKYKKVKPQVIREEFAPFISPKDKQREYFEMMTEQYEKEGKTYYGPRHLKAVTGVIEDKEEIWFHPFRKNQYVYTQVAPFPEINFEHLKIGDSWTGTKINGQCWDNFIGELHHLHNVTSKTNYDYKNLSLDSCWQIESVGTHSILGKSYLNYLFHPQNGFIEMKYVFYDGTRINIYLKEITDKRKTK